MGGQSDQAGSDPAAQFDLLDGEAARALIESFPPPSVLVTGSVLNQLDANLQRFISLSPLCFISSRDEHGVQEVSPRGDPAGSFKVIGERRLAIADRPGNNRIDTLRNLLVSPQLGLIFIIPGVDETLRISGKARISVSQDLLRLLSVSDRLPPRLAIVVDIEKAHLHCAKAFRRSRVWDQQSQISRSMLPSFTAMIADQVKMADEKRAEFEVRIARNNVEGLWEAQKTSANG